VVNMSHCSHIQMWFAAIKFLLRHPYTPRVI
jgi:hypothetical protein